ncbi:MAG: hypothetical protein WCE65_04700, partial [Methanoregula sp.]
MTNKQHQFWSVEIALTAVIFLLVLCTAPSLALDLSGAKYMGSIAPGGTDTQVMSLSIGSNETATDFSVD